MHGGEILGTGALSSPNSVQTVSFRVLSLPFLYHPSLRSRLHNTTTDNSTTVNLKREKKLSEKETARRKSTGPFFQSTCLLLVVNNLVIGLDYIVRCRRASFRSASGSTGLSRLSRLLLPLLLIERLPGLAEYLRQLFLRRADLGGVVATQSLPRALDSRVHLCPGVG